MQILKKIGQRIQTAFNTRYWLVRTLRTNDGLLCERRFKAIPDADTGTWQVYIRMDSRKVLEERPNGEILCGNLQQGPIEKGPRLTDDEFAAYYQKMADGGFVQHEWKWPMSLGFGG